MVLKTICIWKFTPYVTLVDKLCSYIVLTLGTQMHIIIGLCEVFLLCNSIFMKLLPSHKANVSKALKIEKWLSVPFCIFRVKKFGLGNNVGAAWHSHLSPTDCQGGFSTLDQWVAVPLLQTVTTSQEGTLKGGLGLPLPFSNPSRFNSPMSPMSPLALGQALERVNSLCASHFLTLRFFADES